jgi:hypothetical protein
VAFGRQGRWPGRDAAGCSWLPLRSGSCCWRRLGSWPDEKVWSGYRLPPCCGSAGSDVPLVILGGTALRLVFVLLGMIIVQTLDQRLGFREFIVWLGVFYLGLLMVETCLVLLSSASRSGQPRVGGV